jgi:hypothetical protein
MCPFTTKGSAAKRNTAQRSVATGVLRAVPNTRSPDVIGELGPEQGPGHLDKPTP